MPFPPEWNSMTEAQQLHWLRSPETRNPRLIQSTRHDPSGRPIHEFTLSPGATKMGTWMGQFAGEALLQERIYKAPATRPGQYAGSSPIEQPAAWSKKMIVDALRPVRQDIELSGTVERSRADADAIYLAQQRARGVLEMNRRMVLIPGPESVLDYRRRIVAALQPNTSLAGTALRNQSAQEFADSETRVLREAAANYLRPRDVPAGELVRVVRHDSAGREITEYATGQKGVADPIKYPAQAFRKVFGSYMGPAIVSAVHVNGVPQPAGYYKP